MSKEELNEIWSSHGFPAIGRLWKILKQKGLAKEYHRKEVAEYIAGKKVSQLHHKPVKVKFSHITTNNPGNYYNIDLLDVTAYSRANRGIKWLMLCIDVFSRKAAIVGMINKTAPVATEAMRVAFDMMGQLPRVLLTDQGSEFKGTTGKLLDELGVIHKTADVGDHHRLGIVDRFSAIVKGWIHKHMTHYQTKSYINELDQYLDAYNAAPHSSLGGMSPNEAWRYPSQARNVHYRRIKKAMSKNTGTTQKLHIGDHVRVLKLRNVFSRGYHVRYSLTVHTIVDKRGLNYILDNGRWYRASRLLKVPPEEEKAASPVADVAQEARQERRREVVLQQEGVDPEANPPLRRSARARKPQYQVIDESGAAVRF